MGKKTNLLSILATRKFWTELLIMTFGMVIAGTAVYYFLVPSNLIVGSITGLSMVINKLAMAMFGTGDNLSSIILVINGFLLILSYFLIGKEFGAKTVYTALILGPIIEFLTTYFPYENIAQTITTASGQKMYSMMGDPWLDMLAFVIILSASQAILFKINASTGGLDILGKIINKYLHMDIGVSVSIAGALICCTAFMMNEFNMVVLGLMGTWINGLVIDYFSTAMNSKKRVHIVSNSNQELRQYIINELKRGCTLYEVTGGYSNEKMIELDVLLSKDEFSQLMNKIKEDKIDAFITADSISEVYGIWAGKERKQKPNTGKRGKSMWITIVLILIVVAGLAYYFI